MWAEPLATSLDPSRREVIDLEAGMNVVSASYLLNPGDRQSAAATEAQVAQLESSLEGFAGDFSIGITDALKVHAEYLKLPNGGYLELDGTVIRNKGIDSQLLMAYTTLGQMLAALPPKIALFMLQLLQAEQFLPFNVEFPELSEVSPPPDPTIASLYVDLAKADKLPVKDALSEIAALNGRKLGTRSETGEL